MGLANFRWRLLFIVGGILLLWQVSKVWIISSDETPGARAQLQEGPTIPSLNPEDDHWNDPVTVAVYYEALCPDSRSFFIKQLLPTYQKIGDNVQIELIPYGKATTRKSAKGYEFECQHGPVECEANIIHACSIAIIKDASFQLEYLTCMIKNNMDPTNIMASCAKKLNIDANSILKCYKGERGKELLAENGEKTHSLVPKVSFIPTIALNKNTQNQARILKNLLHEVCLLFKIPPKGCLD